jgi:putative SOS response-associated peptidase YedK
MLLALYRIREPFYSAPPTEWDTVYYLARMLASDHRLAWAGSSIQTFAIITTDANELVAEIHDRMSLMLAPGDYIPRLSDDEPDPRDLMRLFPAEPVRMWPISTRINKPENDDPSIIEPIELSAATA